MKKTLLLLLVLICQLSSAQNGFNNYLCTLTNGTSQFLNKSSLTIDNSGNKWIGFKRINTSSLSLLRYDGSIWTNFTSNINAPVLALETDATGNVWIGTLNAGLIKYDGATFTSFTRSNSVIVSDTITSLAFINNKLYIGSYNGFSEYDGINYTNFSRANSGLSSDSIFCFTAEASQIWIGTHKGLNNYNGTNSISYIGSNDTINAIALDAANNKWLGTNSNGLVKYNNSSYVNVSTLIPDVFGGSIPKKIVSLTTSTSGNIIVNVQRVYDAYTAVCGLMEIMPNNSYQLYLYDYNRMNGGCYFKKDQNGIIYFIDHKLQNTSTPALYQTKTFLHSFDQSQFNASAAISQITPENTQYLDINMVKAGCNPSGDMHTDGEGNLYEVPKGTGLSPIKATNIWIGGYAGNDLRVAANTESNAGEDTWPGTIHTLNGTTDSTNAQLFNRVWKINRFDIENFNYNFAAGNVQNGSYTIPTDILEWPGNGSFGNDPLAPYFDYNNDMHYDAHDGDYPLVKGDQMLWWVYNDALSAHTSSGSLNPLNVQVMASAYAYTCPTVADSDKVINYTTFYNYRIRNKGTNPIDSMYIGIRSEVDLGFYNDDYIGCDVENNFSYVYNGDNYDEDAVNTIGEFKSGYKSNTPFLSCNLLRGPGADPDDGKDNDRDGCIDCTFWIDSSYVPPFLASANDDTLNERIPMSKFTYYNNDFSNMGNPTTLKHYYNYMTGSWKNDSRMRYDNAAGTSTSTFTPVCDYVFPGNSDLAIGYGVGGTPTNPNTTTTTWSEITASNSPGNRRMLTSVGKVTFMPGQTQELDFAYVFTQDSATLVNGNLYARVVSDNKKIKKWFRDNNAPSCLDLSGVGLKEQTNQIKMAVYPNPANNVLNIDAGSSNTITGIKVMDILGKEISSQSKVNSSSLQLTISSLQSGVYLLHVTTEKGTYFGKFIKQ
ncbi:MAG: T9SS type A sorting domain-containing protein [Bacteroidota bacterium]|nr:T9SS type A sorting domain-containing protein [Bacteroidota bacterium]